MSIYEEEYGSDDCYRYSAEQDRSMVEQHFRSPPAGLLESTVSMPHYRNFVGGCRLETRLLRSNMFRMFSAIVGENFTGATLRIIPPNVTLLIFENGSVRVIGAAAADAIPYALQQFRVYLARRGFKPLLRKMSIDNRVASGNVLFPLCLEQLHSSIKSGQSPLGGFSVYMPELFPGLVYPVIALGLTFMLYQERNGEGHVLTGKLMILGTKQIEATERAYCKLLQYVSEFRDNTFVPNVRNKAKERTSKKRIAEQATAIASSAAAASVRVTGAAVIAKPSLQPTAVASTTALPVKKPDDDDEDSFDSDAEEGDSDRSENYDRFEENEGNDRNPDADVDRREDDQDEESENADAGFEELTLRSVVKNKDVVTIANRVHEMVGNDEELAQQMIEKELLELAHRRSARRSKIEAKKRAKLAHTRDQDDGDALCQEIHSLFENNDQEPQYDEDDPYSYTTNGTESAPAVVIIADPMDEE